MLGVFRVYLVVILWLLTMLVWRHVSPCVCNYLGLYILSSIPAPDMCSVLLSPALAPTMGWGGGGGGYCDPGGGAPDAAARAAQQILIRFKGTTAATGI